MFWLQTKEKQIPERKWAQDCPLQNITNHTLCLETVDCKSSVLEGDEFKTGPNESLNIKWERFTYELTSTGNQDNQEITVKMQRVAYFITLLANWAAEAHEDTGSVRLSSS